MNKNQEKELYEDIKNCIRTMEETYQMSSLLTKFCEKNPDSDDLYEVSYVLKLINEHLRDVTVQLHSLLYRGLNPLNISDLGKKMQFIKDKYYI